MAIHIGIFVFPNQTALELNDRLHKLTVPTFVRCMHNIM